MVAAMNLKYFVPNIKMHSPAADQAARCAPNIAISMFIIALTTNAVLFKSARNLGSDDIIVSRFFSSSAPICSEQPCAGSASVRASALGLWIIGAGGTLSLFETIHISTRSSAHEHGNRDANSQN